MVAEVSILGRVVDFLSSAPTDEAILGIKATNAETNRLDYLSERQASGFITVDELDELKAALIAEQMMIIAKANAHGRLNR